MLRLFNNLVGFALVPRTKHTSGTFVVGRHEMPVSGKFIVVSVLYACRMKSFDICIYADNRYAAKIRLCRSTFRSVTITTENMEAFVISLLRWAALRHPSYSELSQWLRAGGFERHS